MSALDFDKNLAVVIGIDQYINGIAPLRTAVADARSVAYMLEQEHDYQVLMLLDQHAQLANLQELIQQTLPSLLSENSRLLFYFAGHGIAQDGDDGPAGYLIPQDAVPGTISSYLTMVSLHDELTALPCRHFLAIFDCCFAGAFRWSSTRKITVVADVIHRERYDRFRQDPAWQVITSASYDQRAMDMLSLCDERGEVVDSHNQQCHSPFAAALIQALKGDADSSPPAKDGKPAGDGVITATELYLYLRDQVEVLTESISRRQTPEICTLRNHDKGEFIFLTPGHTLNLPPAPELNKENNPYRGLESFDQAHKDLFFGRDEEIARLLKRLNDPHPMTVVLGASGTGKSSLVKAGLLPQLADNSKYQVLPVMRPGNSPLEALSRACRELALGDGVKALTHQFETDEQSLARLIGSWQQGRANQPANAKLVLVIDQAEELITQANTPEESTQFQRLVKRAMAEHWRYFRVVATLRLDFEAQFQDEELKEGWMDSRFVIPPMSQAQLRDAIEKPAEARVLYFEPSNLVDKLVEDVAQTPGALPLLSFTLSELYLRYLDRRSDNRALTEEDYRALGGVTGALKERATQEYEMLLAKDAAYEKTVKHVMLRMVAVEGGELARRRVPLSELVYSSAAENERVDTLLENLIKARLLVRGQEGESEPYVEPAHDALVRGWDRLLRWKNEEQVSLGLQRELTPQARNWQAERATGKQRKANGFLWNGNPRLDLLKETLKSDASWLNVLETKFVQRSLERKRNRLGFGVAMTVSVMVALGGLAFFGFNQALKAEANAVEAEKNADEAEANAVEAEKNAREAEANAAEAEENAREAKANADEALKNQKEAEKNALEANQQQQRAEEALERAEAGEAEARQQTELAEKETKRAQYQEAVALLREQAARVLNLLPTNDAVSGLVIAIDTMARSQSVPAVEMVAQSSLLKAVQISQEMNRLEGHESEVLSLAFSPDGQRIVSGSKDGTLRFWDAQTGVPLSDLLKGHESEVWSVAFSLDNQRIVSGGRDGIRLWDAQTGALLSDPLEGHGWVDSVAFSPDGQRIVSSGRGGRSRLWDAQTGAPIGAPLEDYGVAVLSVTFSPDGQRIVSGSKDGTLRFWDAQTSASLGASIEGNGSTVWSMAFSPDGQRIVSGSEDGTLRLRGTQTGARSASTEGNGSTVWSVAFSPDGQRIVSGSEDGTLRLWDTQTGARSAPLMGHGTRILSVAFSPDGQRIASGSNDGTLRLWNAQTGKPLEGRRAAVLEGNGAVVYSVSFSPDGQRIVSGSIDGTLRLWDAQTGEPLSAPIQGNGAGIPSVAFSPDGHRIVSGSMDGRIRLWGAQTGAPIGAPLEGHNHQVVSVTFSPDGQRIVSGSIDRTLRLWNAQTGAPIGLPLEGHTGVVSSVAFSPDGQHIVSGSSDGMLRLWDAQTSISLSLPFEGHENGISSVAFSPDGQRIVSGSIDGTLLLWNAQTGTVLGEPLEGHRGAVWSVAFSPDGQRIVSSSSDGTLRLWEVSPKTWIDIACKRLQYHPLLNQPETISNDKEFYEVAARSRAVCQQRDWGNATYFSQPPTNWVGNTIHRFASAFGQ